ncbi:DUF5776 domain-containing protein [Apilactobacillus timberlakei]|uniref:DUF5776 domain-containing protein n=1 Tax=Apilactobacillus timberlakei TaxID=2008380 RepID=UPI0011288252|nr:DUF5776 domain-containing protein [Apilactobacillus timberlakei]TPR16745.1 hypothetical protein DYZ95_07125 [Apilactobacillus timberlakei]TPR21508.1 hypothetical protein DY083_05675 [Apilactobacillus timberlakei]
MPKKYESKNAFIVQNQMKLMFVKFFIAVCVIFSILSFFTVNSSQANTLNQSQSYSPNTNNDKINVKRPQTYDEIIHKANLKHKINKYYLKTDLKNKRKFTIKVKKKLYTYKKDNLLNKLSIYSKGKRLRCIKIIKGNHINSFELTNHNYVTANKDFVKLI